MMHNSIALNHPGGNVSPQSITQTEVREPVVANQIIAVVAPLLTLMIVIRRSEKPSYITKLRQQIIEEIKLVQQRLHQLQYTTRTIMAVRYCLCTMIDEVILSTTWGSQSEWVQESLLSFFHKETWGGERFYIIAENMAREPRTNLAFLEFCYLLLSLGFEGKFYGDGVVIREEIRNRIFYRIRNLSAKPNNKLAFSYGVDQMLVKTRSNKGKLKKLFVGIFVAMIITFACFNYESYRNSAVVITVLDHIATVSPVTTFSQIIQRPVVPR